ncbi:MAG: 23S rRNA (guanosine(2251)-2'-O)-methyltransferase RlmB [Cytophagales bacterium]
MESKNSDIIFGLHPVLEAIKAQKDIEKLLIQKGSANTNELINKANEAKIPFQIVPPEKLSKITKKNHQGVIGFVANIRYCDYQDIVAEVFEKGETPLILILDKVTDVRNFGAISRTAECAGVHAIIIPDKGSARINSDAVKTSAGALNYIPICREHNLKTVINDLKNSGLQVVACTEKSDKILYDIDLKVPTAIIMGSEEEGISPEYLKLSTEKVKIPMYGEIGSLNVGVASAIIIYECIRQRSL